MMNICTVVISLYIYTAFKLFRCNFDGMGHTHWCKMIYQWCRSTWNQNGSDLILKNIYTDQILSPILGILFFDIKFKFYCKLLIKTEN